MVARAVAIAAGLDGLAGGGVAFGRDRVHDEMARTVEHHLERAEPLLHRRFGDLVQTAAGPSFSPSVL